MSDEAVRLFGTNGVRGVVNELLTPELAMGIGRAVGTVVRRSGSPVGTEILVGADTRCSTSLMCSSICAGLLSTGCRAVDVGVLPTPAIQYGVKNSQAAMGIMITASHNPPEYNGIKTIAGDGTETTRDEEELVERAYHACDYVQASWKETPAMGQRKNLVDDYISGIKSIVDVGLIKGAGLNVALDCANGATHYSAPRLMEELGAGVVTLNAQPSGMFPGHPSEPTEAHLKVLQSLVRETDADFGLAHDGDGDRAIFLDEKGQYLYGDKTLALAAKYVVEENGGGKVVTAINTSSVLEDVVKDAGGEVVYTPIGSPIVARVMMREKAVFGGEENGGLIFPKFQYCRDGGMTSAAMLEILAKKKRSLSELIAELPEYHLCKLKFKYPVHLRETILKKYLEQVEHLSPQTMDGVKLVDEGGWTLVRPSGTEAIYRIQVEDKDPIRARDKAEAAKKVLLNIISDLER